MICHTPITLFNTVDSFDTHAKIPEFYEAVDAVAAPAQKTALISVGWDPGYSQLIVCTPKSFYLRVRPIPSGVRALVKVTSDAVRRVEGVKAGVQYTLPSEAAMAECA